MVMGGYNCAVGVLGAALMHFERVKMSLASPDVAQSVILTALIGAMGRWGFSSSFLSVCGLLSYELVLLHGPLLIRHNPVFGLLPENLIVLSFVIFLVAALVVAAVFHWFVGRAQRFVSNWI